MARILDQMWMEEMKYKHTELEDGDIDNKSRVSLPRITGKRSFKDGFFMVNNDGRESDVRDASSSLQKLKISPKSMVS